MSDFENQKNDQMINEDPSSKIEFFLPIKIPTVTAQERRVILPKSGKGKPIFVDTPQLANARGKYLAYLAQHRPAKKLTGPLALRIVWVFKSTKNHVHGSWKTSKPDTDNMIKLFKDCMTRVGFWTDDALVAWELQEKRYGDIEGIFVQINPLLSPLEEIARTKVTDDEEE